MNKWSEIEVSKKTLLIILIIIMFAIGYYLRAYLSLISPLPYSPYEIYESPHNITFLHTGPVLDYTDKIKRYPTSFLFNHLFEGIFGNFYLIYVLGGLIIFLLGKEISESKVGGLLAFSLYAISSENLIHYTGFFIHSGFAYVSMWTSLLFLLKYFKNKKKIHLLSFFIFSIINLTSYHTAASAMIAIIIGMIISKMYSKEHFDKSLLSVFLILIFFYSVYVIIFDVNQFILMNLAFGKISSNPLIFFIIPIFLTISGFIFYIFRKVNSTSLYIFVLFISIPLIFSNYPFFNFLLKFGGNFYYSSSTTLNNYIAQALLTHIYLIAFLSVLFNREEKGEIIFLRGWLIGMIIISFGLSLLNYYSRIFDYSFPFMFILFAMYWNKKKEFRKSIVLLTIILLIVSQLIILHDPFTLRRYYTKEEVQSVNKVVALNLTGNFTSDLRTASLFSHFGKKDIKFGSENSETHKVLFYKYYEKHNFNYTGYVILSESMRYIIYSDNFETTPINDSVYEYYDTNFDQIYNDGVMHVYFINITKE